MTHSTYTRLQALSAADQSLTVRCGSIPLHMHLAQFKPATCACGRSYMRHVKDEGYVCDACYSAAMHKDY